MPEPTDLTTRAPGPAIAAAEQAVETLQRALRDNLVAVVLFGSQARGEALIESDCDLLVIAENLPSKTFDRHLYFRRLLSPRCYGPLSILARTSAEFEVQVPSLYLDIALDGQILYDPRGYAAERLAFLRRRITELGLYRENTPEGFDWRWKNPPQNGWSIGWEV